jgi:hypothetical protein
MSARPSELPRSMVPLTAPERALALVADARG